MLEQDRPYHPDFSRPDPLVLTEQDQDLLNILLTDQELAQVEQVQEGNLPCPMCEQPLDWLVMIAQEYEGLTLVCCGCGFCEY